MAAFLRSALPQQRFVYLQLCDRFLDLVEGKGGVTDTGGLDERLAEWIAAQPLFFVATAPMSADGHVNCSPKGLPGTFAMLDENEVAYLDLTGSGAETIAHVKENGRIVIMFCAFTKRPRIVRLHGTGEVIESSNPRFSELIDRFPPRRGTRAIILLNVARVADSCGWGVPMMSFERDRNTYANYVSTKSAEQMRASQLASNMKSLDGLPALTEPTNYTVESSDV